MIAAPRIIPRAEWSDVLASFSALQLPTREQVAHHQGGAGPKATTLDELKGWLRGVEHGEMSRGDGLRAIAYHDFVINGGPFDGLVFECRPVDKEGGATLHQNQFGQAVCVSGDMRYDAWTPKALNAVCWLFADMQRRGYTTKGVQVTPHSLYYATACPGDHVRNTLALVNVTVAQILDPAPIDWGPIIAMDKWRNRVHKTPLRFGMQGPDVAFLIDVLRARHYLAKDVDGDKYGDDLQEGVYKFKHANPRLGNTKGENFGGAAADMLLAQA